MRKKFIKYLALGVLSISLAACNNNGGGEKTNTWTNDEVAIMDDVFYGYHLPYLKSKETILAFDEETYAVTVDATEVTADDLTAYLDDVVKSGMVYVTEFSGTKIYEYESESSYLTLQVTHLLDGEATTGDVFMYGTGSYISETFPSDELNKLMTPYGVDENIITFDQATLYQIDRTYYSYGFIDMYCTTDLTAKDCFDNFKAQAAQKGYTVHNGAPSLEDYTDEAYNATKEGNLWNIEATYDSEYETFDISYILASSLEEGGNEGTSDDTSFEDPNVDPGDFDFLTKAQLVSSNESKAVWKSGDVTLTVEVGDSATLPGNPNGTEDYFANPLRVYQNQIITLSVPETMSFDNVVFDMVVKGKSKVDNILNAAWTGTSSVEQTSTSPVFITATASAGATSISFIPTGQVHLNSIDVTLSK